MHDLLIRLQNVKRVLVCLLLVASGITLMTIDRQLDSWQVWSWIPLLPWGELGGLLIGAGVLGVWIDHYFSREKDASDELRLQRILQDQAPAMRDAVLQAFAANHEDLERIATPEMLDQIIGNSLALRLNDARFANEIYADIRDQAVTASERWHDATVSIDLSPLTRGTKKLFTVTVRWEYTTIPTHAERRFACVSDREEYIELAHERGSTTAWFINPAGGIDARSEAAFELMQFSVDGEQRPIRRATRKHSQLYTASVGAEHVQAGKPVTIAYTYRTVTAQHGHLLHFDIQQPTRDITVELDYSDCAIANVSVLDLIASIRPTRIERSPKSLPMSSVRVELDGWVFPRSGVAFVWVLESEIPKGRSAANRAA
jgi:hypothetical protein